MKSLRHRALDLLAARDHSCHELRKKLVGKGFAEDEVDSLIEALVEENLLDDQRFVESYVRYRVQAGYGPVRIRHELQQRGVNAGIIDGCFADSDIDWRQVLHTVWQKKYADNAAELVASERAKRQRFLYQRGFLAEHIRDIFDRESIYGVDE